MSRGRYPRAYIAGALEIPVVVIHGESFLFISERTRLALVEGGKG